MVAVLALVLAIAPSVREGDAQAFSSLLDAQGNPLADGRYSQRVENGLLRIDARYDFADGRIVEEHATLRLEPQLEQKSWEWTERKDGSIERRYTVDFDTGQAYALRGDQKKAWQEKVDVHPGKTFAGIAFITVIKDLRSHVADGKSFDLEAVAFTPKPRTVGVELQHVGPEKLSMASRSLPADRWTIHPKVPAIAKLFVKAPDQQVWLLRDDPPAFLRFEGPLAEPTDPVIRIDTIPSAPANQARRASTRDRRATPRKAPSPEGSPRARR